MKFRAFLEKNLSLIHSVVFAAAIILLVIIANNGQTSGWDEYRSWHSSAGIDEAGSSIVEDDEAMIGKLKVYELFLIGDVTDEDTLSFFVIHANTKVYINGNLKLSVEADEKAVFGRTPGSYFVYVPLTREDKDASVKVVLEPVYKSALKQEIDFDIDLSSNIINNNFRREFWQLLCSVMSIILGLVFFLIARMSFDNPRDNYVSFLSFFAILIGLWKLMDIKMIPELTNLDPKTCSYISLTMFFFMAPPFVMFAKKQIGSGHERLLDFAFILSLTSGVVSLVMQLLGIADYRQVLSLTHITIAVSLTIVTVVISMEFMRHKDDRKIKTAFFGFVICSLGALADFIPFYQKGVPTEVPFTLLAFDIFIFLTGSIAIWDLSRKASTDFNTGLYNRSRCTDHISDNMILTKKSRTTFVMFDLNFLKKVNDTYGHAEGDKLILAFANILNTEVPGGSFTGRYGGDEFIVTLYGDKSERLTEMLDGIEKAVKEYNENAEVQISYSEGHAEAEEFDGCTMKDLFSLADKRMYENKRVLHEKLGEKMYRKEPKY